MFTRVYIIISKRARALFPVVFSAALFCYFSLHFAGGKYGLESRDQLKAQVFHLESSLNDITKQRLFYEHRTSLLDPVKVRRDIVDELARKSLQFAAPDDLVLFD